MLTFLVCFLAYLVIGFCVAYLSHWDATPHLDWTLATVAFLAVIWPFLVLLYTLDLIRLLPVWDWLAAALSRLGDTVIFEARPVQPSRPLQPDPDTSIL